MPYGACFVDNSNRGVLDTRTNLERVNRQTIRFKDVRANCFCASLLRTQMHTPRHTRARALTNKMRNDRAKGHCYSFAWI